jgi:sigma-54 dependent transcriptional regulator
MDHATFQYCGYNQLQTARFLDISRNVLRAKLKQFGLLNGARSAASDRLRPGDRG